MGPFTAETTREPMAFMPTMMCRHWSGPWIFLIQRERVHSWLPPQTHPLRDLFDEEGTAVAPGSFVKASYWRYGVVHEGAAAMVMMLSEPVIGKVEQVLVVMVSVYFLLVADRRPAAWRGLRSNVADIFSRGPFSFLVVSQVGYFLLWCWFHFLLHRNTHMISYFILHFRSSLISGDSITIEKWSFFFAVGIHLHYLATRHHGTLAHTQT